MTLFLVSTPIGNMEDITLRALRVLREVDVVAAEDTRVAGRLLAAHEIHKPLRSYHEHNEERSARDLLARLEAGEDVALITNGGTPCISDPGFRVVRGAIENDIDVVPIPGATALTAALQLSGLPVHRFLFIGASLAEIDATLILYESPHRIAKLVRDALEVLGPRPAAICRELTKKFEEARRGTLADLAASTEADPPRGEIVLLIAGSTSTKDANADDGEEDSA
jgi:16S rRNA (cytidine1402-2'-O)-methyltransferase